MPSLRGTVTERNLKSAFAWESQANPYYRDFAQKAASLEHEIHKLAEAPINPGSPKQLGDILFGKMGLPGGTKTKTGQWATGARALEDLAAAELAFEAAA